GGWIFEPEERGVEAGQEALHRAGVPGADGVGGDRAGLGIDGLDFAEPVEALLGRWPEAKLDVAKSLDPEAPRLGRQGVGGDIQEEAAGVTVERVFAGQAAPEVGAGEAL